jgi:hypothetical protein
MMKNTTICARFLRSTIARSSGRIRIIAAPVVPTKLAMPVPMASRIVRLRGVPRICPETRIPPATV